MSFAAESLKPYFLLHLIDSSLAAPWQQRIVAHEPKLVCGARLADAILPPRHRARSVG